MSEATGDAEVPALNQHLESWCPERQQEIRKRFVKRAVKSYLRYFQHGVP